jgi:8-hydroxy-5-deazaflavin:NADPH oxidoreductase
MTTVSVIGVGAIGSAVAANLAKGGQRVTLAARDEAHAREVASGIGELAQAASVEQAVTGSDAIVLAVPFPEIENLLTTYADRLGGTVVVDPSNAVTADADGNLVPLLEPGQTAAAKVAALVPAGAHYAKAFGTLGADSLRDEGRREPQRAVLFYAAADERADAVTAELITAAGFAAVSIGTGADLARVELGGDLHQYGGLNGRLVDADEAKNLL